MSKKKKKVYLIDSENVGDRWTDIADKIGKSDKMIVFYSKNHSRQLEEYLMKHVHDTRFMWLECAVGNNALDYQLMGVLSYLAVKNPKNEFHIFSNDQGYQSIIKSWKARGVTILQDGFDISKKKKKKDKANKENRDIKENKNSKGNKDIKEHKNIKDKLNKENAGSLNETCKQVDEAKLVELQLMTEQDYVKELSKCIHTTNLSAWYGLLTAVLGQEGGRTWYTELKNKKELREELAKNFKGTLEVRQVRLIELLLQKNGLESKEAEAISRIMHLHNKKNQQACHKDLVKSYGAELGNCYYRILKPALRTIKELK